MLMPAVLLFVLWVITRGWHPALVALPFHWPQLVAMFRRALCLPIPSGPDPPRAGATNGGQ